jgi:NADH-quinone oxidoreductase E subunit
MFTFTPENATQIAQLRGRYPNSNALVLPCLWMAQYQEGMITLEAVEAIGKLLEIAPMEIYRVATFYTMFNLEPVGTYHIQVCKTLSCMLRGKQTILDQLQERLGITPGQTTSDNRFTLTQVECLGSCGTAPVMQVNETYYENLTPEKVDALLEELS